MMARRRAVGGSVVYALTGASRFRTARQALAGMVDCPEVPLTLPMAKGNAGEKSVRDYVSRTMGLKIREVGIAVHLKYPWVRASPDGIYDVPGGGLGVLEVKVATSWGRQESVGRTVERLRCGKAPLPEIPPEHWYQIHYTAGVLGASEILYCVLLLPSAPGKAGQVLVVKVQADRTLYEEELLPMAAEAHMSLARALKSP